MNPLKTVAHHARVLGSKLREARKESARSSHWASVRDHHLAEHPRCAACGGGKHVQVHHKKPFHEFPELELEPTNLISLCMGDPECHLRLGHGGDYKFYNPKVEQDAAEFVLTPANRAVIVARAKTARLANDGPTKA